MDQKIYVGVDLGGTTVKLAFITPLGEIVKKWEIPTDLSNQGSHITPDIAKSIAEESTKMGLSQENLVGIGMGAPGFIDMETGLVYQAVNLGWRDFPLKESLSQETGLPVIVENDANMAALGEMWQGAGDGAQDLLLLTLGTGVGGGVITNGQMVHGVNGTAGELGHITMVPEGGAPCNCGKTGCLETLTSATGIRRIAVEGLEEHPESSLAALYKQNGNIESKDIFQAADEGDAWALNVVDKVAFYLGLAIANLSNTLNPSKIVIGGGVSKAGDTLMNPLKKHFGTYALPRVNEGAELVIATLGNDAGVIGGAWLVKTHIDQQA